MDNIPLRNAQCVIALIADGSKFADIKHRLTVRNPTIWQHHVFGALALASVYSMKHTVRELYQFSDHLSTLIYAAVEEINQTT